MEGKCNKPCLKRNVTDIPLWVGNLSWTPSDSLVSWSLLLLGNVKSNGQLCSTVLDRRSQGELMMQNDIEHFGLYTVSFHWTVLELCLTGDGELEKRWTKAEPGSWSLRSHCEGAMVAEKPRAAVRSLWLHLALSKVSVCSIVGKIYSSPLFSSKVLNAHW